MERPVRVRFAPSPTGPLHIGGVRTALYNYLFARRHKGTMILRIEDTDSQRFVPGAEDYILESLKWCGIEIDEGVGVGGPHAPYRQSERREIYLKYALQLVEAGWAYYAFDTAEELDALRREAEARGEAFAYNYAVREKLATSLALPAEEVKARLDHGDQWVIRFRMPENETVAMDDLIRGHVEVNTSTLDDKVLYKSADALPTYHLANIVDDRLMEVSHVIRGEEWLPSLPKHLQLFRYLGFKPVKYMHIAQLMRLDENGSKKKLSKRDMGANLNDYERMGYAPECVAEYVMTLLNSNFEEWHAQNADKSYLDFPFSIKKMSSSGCLFDFDKLNDVSKNVLSKLSADEIYKGTADWAKKFDPEFFALLDRAPEYAKSILAIGRGGKKPRKDFAVYADVRPYMDFFYDELFTPDYSYPENLFE